MRPTSDRLEEFRRPGQQPSTPRSAALQASESNEAGSAYEAAQGKTRQPPWLEFRPVHGAGMLLAYPQAMQVLFDRGDDPTRLDIVFTHCMVTVKGRNLGALLTGLRGKTLGVIEQHNAVKHGQPRPGDMVVESIEYVLKDLARALAEAWAGYQAKPRVRGALSPLMKSGRGVRLTAYRNARRIASLGRPVARPKPKPARNALPSLPPFNSPEPRSIISSNLAIQTRKEEDVRYPAHVWTDPAFAEESLQRLRDEYKRHVSSGPNKVAEKTMRKYFQNIDDFLRSMERHGVPLVLGSLTTDSVSLWAEDQEARGNSPHSITGRVISLKVFAHSFIYETLELSKVDLLRKVERPTPKLAPREVLSQDECDKILASFTLDTFEDVGIRRLSPRWRRQACGWKPSGPCPIRAMTV